VPSGLILKTFVFVK